MFKKIDYNAPVTLTFAFLALGAFLLNIATNGRSNELLFMTYRPRVWYDPLALVRLFTYVLGHASWEHYFNNMLYLLLLGPMIEEKYGSKNMIIMIVITAGIGGLINNIFMGNTALLGASGIDFMLIILSSITSVKQGTIPLTLILVFGIYIGTEIYNAVTAVDNVAQFAHIAGGICGAVIGMRYANRKTKILES